MTNSKQPRGATLHLPEIYYFGEDFTLPEEGIEVDVNRISYKLFEVLGQGGNSIVFRAEHEEGPLTDEEEDRLTRKIVLKFLQPSGLKDWLEGADLRVHRYGYRLNLKKFAEGIKDDKERIEFAGMINRHAVSFRNGYHNHVKLSNSKNFEWIAHVYEAYPKEWPVAILMPKTEGITLEQKINEIKEPYQLFSLMCSVVNSLRVWHDNGLLHLDISPSNILVLSKPDSVEGERAFIIDYNSTYDMKDPDHNYVRTESKGYSDPFLRHFETFTKDMDLYSICAVLYRLLFNSVTEDYRETAEYLKTEGREKLRSSRFFDDYPPKLSYLTLKLLRKGLSNTNARYQTIEEMYKDLQQLKDAAKLALLQPVFLKTNLKMRRNVDVGEDLSNGQGMRIIGREDELKRIDDVFAREQICFLWGKGGMGKTAIAQAYMEHVERLEKYHTVHMTRVEFSLKDSPDVWSIINGLEFANLDNVDYRKSDGSLDAEAYKSAQKGALAKLDQNALIVIDNFNVELRSRDNKESWHSKLSDLAGMVNGARLLVTSRTKPSIKALEDTSQEVRPLRQQDRVTLFGYYYGRQLDNGVGEEFACRFNSTILLKLIASLLGEVPYLKYDQVLNDLIKDQSFRENEEEVEHGDATVSVYGHLSRVFEVAKIGKVIGEAEERIMKYMILAPVSGFNIKMLMECGELKNSNSIRRLSRLNWLDIDGAGMVISVHPLIQDMCYQEWKPILEMTQGFHDSVMDYYDSLEDSFHHKTKSEKLKYSLRVLDIMHSEHSGNDFDLTTCYSDIGITYGELREHRKTLEYRYRAFQIFNAFLLENLPNVARVYQSIGATYGALGEPQKALEYEFRALEMLLAILPENHPSVAGIYLNVGISNGELGEHRMALEYQMRALEIFLVVLPENHANVARVYQSIGATYTNLGDYQKALEYGLRALEIHEAVLPENHPDVASSYHNIGVAYDALGEHRMALEYMMRALEISKAVLPESHPDVARVYQSIGVAYDALGEHRMALEYKMRALEISKAVLPESHPNVARVYQSIGVAYDALGEHRMALEYKMRALEISKAVLPESHPDVARVYQSIGLTYGALGNHQKDLEYGLRALEIQEAVLPENHPDVVNSYSNVGMTYGNMKNYKKALEYNGKALVVKKLLPEDSQDLAISTYIQATWYLKQHDFKKALEHINPLVEAYLEDPESIPTKILDGLRVGGRRFVYGSIGALIVVFFLLWRFLL